MHDLPQFRAIAEKRLDPAGYAALLGGLHAYHTAIAAAASRHGLAALSSSSQRADLLASDMATLGAAPPASPAWRAPPAPAMMGALYVAEGSVLGGKVIARQLDYMFADRREGRGFFQGGPGGAARWRRFLNGLAALPAGPADLDTLSAGAEASFALFERCVTT